MNLFSGAALAALTIALSTLSTTVTAAPSVTVLPATSPPTTQVKISGSGFAAFEAVDIYFDTIDLQLAAANSGGSFSKIAITVPKTALPGRHRITATGRQSGTSAQHIFLVRTNWAERGFDIQGDRDNIYENVLLSSNASSLKNLWTHRTGGTFSSPAVANGMVYVGSGNGNVYALNATTGAALWVAVTGIYVFSSPTVANGVVYIGSYDGNLYAFSAATGAKLWAAMTGNSVQSSPAVANGVVYVGSEDHNLYAFNAATGAPLWTAATGNGVFSSPAVVNNVVYVGSDDHNLYAFSATTGAKLWTAATGNGVRSSPAVANGVVYVGSEDHNLYAYNATTGANLWTAATGNTISYSSPAVANGAVYIGSQDSNVYAFDAATAPHCGPVRPGVGSTRHLRWRTAWSMLGRRTATSTLSR